MLLETVEAVELIDPAISSERLVYRLFHEPGVRVFGTADVKAQCSCSRETVEAMLKSFSQDDRDHMVEDGKISVTCEFCSASYVFAPGEVDAKDSLMTLQVRSFPRTRESRLLKHWVPAFAGTSGMWLLLMLAPSSALAQSCPEPLASANAPCAGDRRYVFQQRRQPATLHARDAGVAVAGRWRTSQRADRPQGRRLGTGVSQLRPARRTGESRRRQARAGRVLQNRPQLRLRAVFAARLSAHQRRHGLRRRSGVAGLQQHHHAREGRHQVSGENMWRMLHTTAAVLLVDYPTDAAGRAGSCIFIHVRNPGATGTSGCVAVPEPDVDGLAGFFARRRRAGRAAAPGVRSLQGMSARAVSGSFS